MQRRSFLGSLLALLIPLPKVVPKLKPQYFVVTVYPEPIWQCPPEIWEKETFPVQLDEEVMIKYRLKALEEYVNAYHT